MFFDSISIMIKTMLLTSCILRQPSKNIVKATYLCAFPIYGLTEAVLIAKDMPWKDLTDIVEGHSALRQAKKIFPTMQGVKLCIVNKRILATKSDLTLGVTSDDLV